MAVSISSIRGRTDAGPFWAKSSPARGQRARAYEHGGSDGSSRSAQRDLLDACLRAEQLPGGEPRAFGECLELRPLDRRVYAPEEGTLGEAAVGAAHHALAADELREPYE